jgi:hypothetical protein
MRAFIHAGAVAVLALCLAVAAHAQASGCSDLSALAPTPRVDYYTQIQPIWEIRCSNCHVNFGSSPSADLSLNEEDSWIQLVEIPSVQVPGRLRVQTGQAAASYLFEKINCDLPEAGERMPRGRMPIPLVEQALIRDWIQQGAREFTPPLLFGDGFEPAAGSGQPAR